VLPMTLPFPFFECSLSICSLSIVLPFYLRPVYRPQSHLTQHSRNTVP